MMDRVQNSKHHNEILLLDDFNIDMFKPNPAWVSTMSLFNLHQCVQSPTRVTSTTSTLLDHIYVSNRDIRQTNTYTRTNNQHERSLSGLLHTFLSDSKGKRLGNTTVTYRSYKHFDAGSFLCDLSNTSFDAIYGHSDPDEALAYFYKLFLQVYDKHVPIRRQHVKK